MRPEVDFVVIANHAECQNGLLYLAGAGFTELYQPPAPEGQQGAVHLGIGVSMIVPWSETNKELSLEVAIENEDGQTLWKASDIKVEVGRSPGTVAGTDFRPQIAIGATMPCPPLGGYRVRATFAKHTKSVAFRVAPPPQGNLRIA